MDPADSDTSMTPVIHDNIYLYNIIEDDIVEIDYDLAIINGKFNFLQSEASIPFRVKRGNKYLRIPGDSKFVPIRTLSLLNANTTTNFVVPHFIEFDTYNNAMELNRVLEEKLREITNSTSGLTRDIEGLREDILTKSGRIQELETNINQNEDAIHNKLREIDVLRSALSASGIDVDNQTDKIINLTDEKNNLTSEIDRLNGIIERIQQERDREGARAEREGARAESESARAESESARAELASAIADRESAKAELERVKGELELNHNELSVEFEKYKRDTTEKINSLESKLAEQQGIHSTDTDKLEEIKNELDNAKSELANFSKTADNLEASMARNTELEAELRTINGLRSLETNKLTDLENVKRYMQGVHDQLNDALTNKNAEISVLKPQVNELNAELTGLKEYIAKKFPAKIYASQQNIPDVEERKTQIVNVFNTLKERFKQLNPNPNVDMYGGGDTNYNDIRAPDIINMSYSIFFKFKEIIRTAAVLNQISVNTDLQNTFIVSEENNSSEFDVLYKKLVDGKVGDTTVYEKLFKVQNKLRFDQIAFFVYNLCSLNIDMYINETNQNTLLLLQALHVLCNELNLLKQFDYPEFIKPLSPNGILSYLRIRSDISKNTRNNPRFKDVDSNEAFNYNMLKFDYYNTQKKFIYNENLNSKAVLDIDPLPNQIPGIETLKFTFGPFNEIFSYLNNKQIADNTKFCKEVLDNLKIRPVCIIAYGFSGSGKTTTLIKEKYTDLFNNSVDNPGMVQYLALESKAIQIQMGAYETSDPTNPNDGISELFNGISFNLKDDKTDFIVDGDGVHTIKQICTKKIRDNTDTAPVDGNPTSIKHKISDDDLTRLKAYVTKADITLSDVLDIVLIIRLTRSTINNDHSSRTHVILDLKFMGQSGGLYKQMFVCDFAGIEQTFDTSKESVEMMGNKPSYKATYEKAKKRMSELSVKFNGLASENKNLFEEINKQLEYDIIKPDLTTVDANIKDFERNIETAKKTFNSQYETLIKGANGLHNNKLEALRLIKLKFNPEYNTEKIITNQLTANTVQNTSDFNQISNQLKSFNESISNLKLTRDAYEKEMEYKESLTKKHPNPEVDIDLKKITIIKHILKFYQENSIDKDTEFIRNITTRLDNLDINQFNTDLNNDILSSDQSFKLLLDECMQRNKEGEYIIESLKQLREFIAKSVLKQNHEMYPSFDKDCVPIQCSAYYKNCFGKIDYPETEKDIDNQRSSECATDNSACKIEPNMMKCISDKLSDSSLDQMMFCILGTVNFSITANNPPPIPYVYINDLKQILEELDTIGDHDSVIFDSLDKKYDGNYGKYITKILNDLSGNELLNWIPQRPSSKSEGEDEGKSESKEGEGKEGENNNNLSMVRRLFIDKAKKNIKNAITESSRSQIVYKPLKNAIANVVKHIDSMNSATTIGTLEFIDSITKMGMTETVCASKYVTEGQANVNNDDEESGEEDVMHEQTIVNNETGLNQFVPRQLIRRASDGQLMSQ